MIEIDTAEMLKILEDYDDMLLLPDIKEIFKIGKNKAYKLLMDNEIHSFKMGKSYRIPKTEVIKYIYKSLK